MSCSRYCFACTDQQITEKAHAFVERLLAHRYPWVPDMTGACQRMKEAAWGEWMTRKPDGMILGDGWTFARDWRKRMKEAKAVEETTAGNELGLIVRDSKIVVSSRDVARVFEKPHNDVLKSIRALGCSEAFAQGNFSQSSYINEQNREMPEVLMTRDGFTILAMGYTGEKAMAFKVAYIKAFNAMEDEIRNRSAFAVPTTYLEALKLAADLEEKRLALEAERTKLLTKIDDDAPKVLFTESVKASKDTILIGELSKILKQNGYNTGQNRLFATLRAEGYLMFNSEGKNIPTQRAMELGLFFMTETTINRPGKDPKVVPTTRVTGKGQVYFVNRFCGKRPENVTMLAAQREQATA
jgi:anti-repressor protein